MTSFEATPAATPTTEHEHTAASDMAALDQQINPPFCRWIFIQREQIWID